MDIFRSFESKLSIRLKEKRPLIQVVIGPRQVGKTTALKRLEAERGYYVSADAPDSISPEQIKVWWGEAIKAKKEILLIDEAQKIQNWSAAIKKLWDVQDKENNNFLKVVLTGSASLSLEKGLKESLAGRFELVKATHWSFQEAKEAFGMSLEDYIEFGCFPGAFRFISDLERWGEYVRDAILEPIIGRDLMQLHPIEKPALMRQILGVALNNPAQIISLQKIQGQLQDKGAIATIQHYLELLKGAFLVTGIEKYSPRALRAKVSSPKLIVNENAILRGLMRPIGQKISKDLFGRYFENAIIARFIEAGWDVFYWSHRTHEVDAVVIGPNGEHWAIEVKSGQAQKKDLKGLFEFIKINKKFEPKLISLENQKIDGVESLDAAQILSLT